MAMVSLTDVNRQWFKSRVGLAVAEIPRQEAFCAHAIMDDAPKVLVIRNALKDERFMHNPLVTGPAHIRFYAGAVIIVEGVRLGTLCVIDTEPRYAEKFGEKEIGILSDIAAMVADIITAQRRKYLSLTNETVSMASSVFHLISLPLKGLVLDTSCLRGQLDRLRQSSRRLDNVLLKDIEQSSYRIRSDAVRLMKITAVTTNLFDRLFGLRPSNWSSTCPLVFGSPDHSTAGSIRIEDGLEEFDLNSVENMPSLLSTPMSFSNLALVSNSSRKRNVSADTKHYTYWTVLQLILLTSAATMPLASHRIEFQNGGTKDAQCGHLHLTFNCDPTTTIFDALYRTLDGLLSQIPLAFHHVIRESSETYYEIVFPVFESVRQDQSALLSDSEPLPVNVSDSVLSTLRMKLVSLFDGRLSRSNLENMPDQRLCHKPVLFKPINSLFFEPRLSTSSTSYESSIDVPTREKPKKKHMFRFNFERWSNSL